MDLRHSLFATLSYFDIFDYPLTFEELRRFRRRPNGDAGAEPSAAEMLEALACEAIGADRGFYFLRGREAIAAERLRRYRLAEKKFRRARLVARAFRRLPSVRLVAVCNSLAMSNSVESSDIDLFIVVKSGLLWITRLLTVGLLAALGLRPKGDNHADRICASFFISEDSMDLSRLALPGGDVYLRYWCQTLVPIYDAGGVADAFKKANSWVFAASDFIGREPGGERACYPMRAKLSAPILLFLRRFESSAKRWQLRHLPAAIAEAANLDSRVLVSDDILKFHVNDRRAHFEELYQARLRSSSAV